MKWSQSRAVWEPGDRASPLHDTLNEHFLGNAEVPSQDVRSANAPCSLAQGQAKGALPRPAVITLQSGGRTEIRPALSAFWRFDLPAAKAGTETMCGTWGTLAIRFGGDPDFRQPEQAGRARENLSQIDRDSRDGNAALGPTNSSARPFGAGRVNVIVPCPDGGKAIFPKPFSSRTGRVTPGFF